MLLPIGLWMMGLMQYPSYSFLDVYRLAGMLHYKFNLSITVQSHENRPVIYIKSESKLYFKNLIVKYMHPSMMYKLG